MFIFLPENERVEFLIRDACYDCHSNNTRYPWYSRISPVSWYLDKHVQEGKEEVNFHEFGQLDNAKRIGVLSDICQVLEDGSMPLKSYLSIHKHARIDSMGRAEICGWTESSSVAILRE